MATAATQSAQSTPRKTPMKKTPKKASQFQQSTPAPEPEDSQQQIDDQDESQMTNGYGDAAENAADDAQDQAGDAEEQGEQAAGGAGEDAGDEGDEPQSVAEGDPSLYPASSIVRDYSSSLGAQSQAEDAGDEAQDEAESQAEGAQSQAGDIASKAAGAKDQAQGTAEEGAEEAQGKADDAQEQGEEAAEGAADQAQGEAGDVVPIGKVGDDGKTIVDDDGQVVGQVSEGQPDVGSIVDQEGDVMDSEGNVIGKAEPNEDGAAEQAEGALEGAKDQAEGAADEAKDQAESAAEEGQEKAEEGVEQAKQQKPSFEGALTADQDGAVKDEAGNTIANLEEDEAKKLGDQEIADIDAEGNLLSKDGEVLAKGQIGPDVKMEDIEDQADEAQENPGEAAENLENMKPSFEGQLSADKEGAIKDEAGNTIANLGDEQLKKLGDQEIGDIDAQGQLLNKEGEVIAQGQLAPDVAMEEIKKAKPEFEGQLTADNEGAVKDEAGNTIANLGNEELQKLGDQKISDIDAQGNLLNEQGEVLAKGELAQDVASEEIKKEKPDFEGQLKAGKDGAIKDETGKVIANLSKDELKKLGKGKIADIDGDGNLLDKDGNVLAKAEIPEEEELDYTILDGCKVNKVGNVTNEDGTIVGRLVDGDVAKLAGKACDEEGRLWDDKGKQIGQCEPLPKSEQTAAQGKPFEDFDGAVVERSGDVTFEGRVVGKLVEGDNKQCEGKKVDADGDVSDKNGNTIGRAERIEDEQPEEAPPEIDYSILIGHKVNKQGAVVNEDDGTPLGKVVEGELKNLIGKKVSKEGKIFNDGGDPIGRAEPLPENERVAPNESPFEDFDPSVVQKNGDVMYEGQKVGEVSEGDPKQLAGKHVDAEGDIVDKSGSVIGKAVRWEEPEQEPEPEVDNSPLAGKRVNKQGYLADPQTGTLYGRVVEGDPKKLQGKMADKEGNIWDEGGNKVGRAELIPESEREGSKSGPFTDFQPCTVNKEGKVVDSTGTVRGRLTEGEADKLNGKKVDEDGDINDQNGNKIGAAERFEEEEKEADKHPAQGLKVNGEGNVMDQNGDKIAQLTEGEISHCRGKEIDNDGDVVDQKGKSIGHVTLLEDLKPEGPSEEELQQMREKEEAERSQQEKEALEQAEKDKDKDLAKRLGFEIDQTLDRIKPVLDEMMEYVEDANNKPKEEVDEQALVDNVKPLIHKSSDILNECNSNIRGMDPDGRIQSKAKQNAGSSESTPEENHLAEGLKTLTGSVTDTIDKAKKKVSGLPHAKKELNPLWYLMEEPLFQILAAVGLLLAGVLGLVGKLLGGLGLGGIVDNLLGGLGLNNILDGLGLGGALGGK